MTKEAALLEEAKRLAQSVQSWADLSNLLFDPFTGIVATAFSTTEERKTFAQTAEFEQIQQLLDEAIDRFGLEEGATPKSTGPFWVGLPGPLYSALEHEAAAKGLSVNQLVIAKLSEPSQALAGVG
jgi:predicted HicB family RNase H-like nuclease